MDGASALSFHASSASFDARKIFEVPAMGLPSGTRPDGHLKWATLDANVIIILVALLLAFLCALGLNFIVRCSLDVGTLLRTALRRSRPVVFEPADDGHVTVGIIDDGFKKVAVNALPAVTYGKGSQPGTDCPICLADFVEGDVVRVLPICNHVFHVDCIDTWLHAHSSCPTCRRCLLEIVRENKSPTRPSDTPSSVQPSGS